MSTHFAQCTEAAQPPVGRRGIALREMGGSEHQAPKPRALYSNLYLGVSIPILETECTLTGVIQVGESSGVLALESCEGCGKVNLGVRI